MILRTQLQRVSKTITIRELSTLQWNLPFPIHNHMKQVRFIFEQFRNTNICIQGRGAFSGKSGSVITDIAVFIFSFTCLMQERNINLFNDRKLNQRTWILNWLLINKAGIFIFINIAILVILALILMIGFHLISTMFVGLFFILVSLLESCRREYVLFISYCGKTME